MVEMNINNYLNIACQANRKSFLLWTSTLPAAVSTPGFLEEYALQLCQLMYQSLLQYQNPKLRRQVYSFFKQCIKYDVFLEIAAAMVIKLSTNANQLDSTILLRWTFIILDRLPETSGIKAARKIIDCQVNMLEAIYDERITHALTMELSQLLKLRAWLLDYYLNLLESTESQSAFFFICISLQSLTLSLEWKDKVIDRILTLIFCLKNVLDASDMQKLKFWIASITLKRFEEIFIPLFYKFSKRNPEVCFSNAALLIKHTKLDLSSVVNTIMDDTIMAITHTREAVRQSLCNLLASVCSKVLSVDVIEQILGRLLMILDNSSCKVSERISVMQAVTGIVTVSRGNFHNFENLLIKRMRNEKNESVVQEAILTLQIYLTHSPVILPLSVDFLSQCLNEKDVYRKPVLKSLMKILESAAVEKKSLVKPIIEQLMKIYKLSLPKQSQRSDCIMLLNIFVYLSNDMDVLALLKFNKIWDPLFQKDFFLYQPQSIGKLQAEDMHHLIKYLKELKQQNQCQITKELEDSLYQLFALFFFCSDSSVYKQANITLLGISSEPSNYVSILKSLNSWSLDLQSVWNVFNIEYALPINVLHQRLFDFLRGLLKNAPIYIKTNLEIIVQVALLVNCPSIKVSNKSTCRLWKLVSRYLRTDMLLEDDLYLALSAVLECQLGANYKKTELRQRALGALKCIISDNDSACNKLLEWVGGLIRGSNYQSLTDTDILIYNTPRGRAAVTINLMELHSESSNAGLCKLAASKKNNSDFSSIDLRAKMTKDKHHSRLEKQLESEEQIRLKVLEIKENLDLALNVLEALIYGATVWAMEHLISLENLVNPLLTFELVAETSAFYTKVAIVKSSGNIFANKFITVATAVKASLKAKSSDKLILLPDHYAIKTTMELLCKCTSGRTKIPRYALLVSFPVIKVILQLPEISQLHEGAINVLKLHASEDMLPLQADIFPLLYKVLAVVPAYRGKLQGILDDLCNLGHKVKLECILVGMTAADPLVRNVALCAIQKFHEKLSTEDRKKDEQLTLLVWLIQHDSNVMNAETALEFWSEYNFVLPSNCIEQLLVYLGHEAADIRTAAAEAISYSNPDGSILDKLLQMYQESLSWELRSGVSSALSSCASIFTSNQVFKIVEFLMSQGVLDENDNVRYSMIDAGVVILEAQSTDSCYRLLPLLEGYFVKQSDVDECAYDKVRQAAVIFIGSLAGHLTDMVKLKKLLGILLDVLDTPSEEVQKAAAACLPGMVKILKGDSLYMQSIISGLLDKLFKAHSYGVRKGSAYGIAGLVAGLKISALNKYNILENIKAALLEKDANTREACLLTIECLTTFLNRLFEPYSIGLMEPLLERFGDNSSFVRAANEQAVRAIMANLSKYGLQLVLPALLSGVESKAWRSKEGSVQMLGLVAHLAPQHLSAALPQVVTKLSVTLSDPHPKVQAASRRALKEVGSVIRNPEVRQMAPSLLSAIADPEKNSKKALEVLLNTTFVNTVDAASLALIFPIVYKSLRDRNGDMKKRAAKIIGNICLLLNDPLDMSPYVDTLIPELQQALIDPLPEVRATAAKAFGSVLHGMGKDLCQDLMPWLLSTLKSEGSSVERSGAAQGIAEICGVMGSEFFLAILPEILTNCGSKNSYVREGHITLFKFLPAAIGNIFQGHLALVLPAVLDGFADESEGVRQAALAAGQTFVQFYAHTAMPLLLPTIQKGIINDNWRIRQSSVDLLGKLLFKVAGTSGKVQQGLDDDNEGISSEAHGKALILALGKEKRNEILSIIYLARSDIGVAVRSAAIHVWKTLVTNTPRTLVEILPLLMDLIIHLLASTGEEQQQMAGACLGELSRKMGERVLKQIVPILLDGTQSHQVSTRVGVCVGLTEVLVSISTTQLKEHLPQLLPAIQHALVDTDSVVREAAGRAFSVLFCGGGVNAVENMIPSMLLSLADEMKSAQTLEGLRVLLSVRPQTLGLFLPRLLSIPLASYNIKAIGCLMEVSGLLNSSTIAALMPPLLEMASSDDDLAPLAESTLKRIIMVVNDDCLSSLVGELESALEEKSRCLASVKCIANICENTRLKLGDCLPALIKPLLLLTLEEDSDLILVIWSTITRIMTVIDKQIIGYHLDSILDAVNFIKEKQRRKRVGSLRVPGFCNTKALGCLLPVYLHVILQGGLADLRLRSVCGINDLLEMTDYDGIKPYVIMLTGPLIRIIGDRFPHEIRIAVLETLKCLIFQAGITIKPFLPQLQTTFLKCLTEQARSIRLLAAENIGLLSIVHNRIDVLTKDLLNHLKASDLNSVDAYVVALSGIFSKCGTKISIDNLQLAGTTILLLMDNIGNNESLVISVGELLGNFTQLCDDVTLQLILDKTLKMSSDNSAVVYAQILMFLCKLSSARLERLNYLPKVFDKLVVLEKSSDESIREAVCRAIGYLVVADASKKISLGAFIAKLKSIAILFLNPEQGSNTLMLQLHILRTLSLHYYNQAFSFILDLLPATCSLLSSLSGSKKLTVERTLSRMLQAPEGEAVAKTNLSKGGHNALLSVLDDIYVRRLSKLPLDDEDDSEF